MRHKALHECTSAPKFTICYPAAAHLLFMSLPMSLVTQSIRVLIVTFASLCAHISAVADQPNANPKGASLPVSQATDDALKIDRLLKKTDDQLRTKDVRAAEATAREVLELGKMLFGEDRR